MKYVVFCFSYRGGYDNLVSGNLESAGAIVGGVNNKVEKSHYGLWVRVHRIQLKKILTGQL